MALELVDPNVFGLAVLTYWRAVGLLVLAKLVFGGFEGHGPKSHRKKSKKRYGHRKGWSPRKDFFKWRHYDRFWKEEGEKAYNAYVSCKEEENKGDHD